MPTIGDLKTRMYKDLFRGLAAKAPSNVRFAKKGAETFWPRLKGIDPSALGCDADLVTLGLAKNEGESVVYKKLDLSGWNE